MINVRKAAIIGCGFVGSSIAFSLMQRGLYSELVLIDANQAKAEGEAMDLSHGLPYAASMQIYAGTYDDVADCAMVILTAGASQKPGESRLDLIDKNVAILKSIIPELTKRLFQGILLVVSNPVDVLTYAAWKLSGLPARHVIGSGTVLDTAPSILYNHLYNTVNTMLDQAAERIALELISMGHHAVAIPRDGYLGLAGLRGDPSAFFSHRHAAYLAGMGTFGYNNMLLTERYGPRIRLASIVTSAELPSGSPMDRQLCTGCRRCVRECPANARYVRWGCVAAILLPCTAWH